MNSKIPKEWLQWFDARMEERKVELLIDSFLAHQSGLDLVVAESGLQNVKVIILPMNVTSFCQPLDQGIICSKKAYYHYHWVQYMVDKHIHD